MSQLNIRIKKLVKEMQPNCANLNRIEFLITIQLILTVIILIKVI